MEIIHFSMKAKSIITIALMAVLGLSSCDSNKSTVEDLTNQFIAAVKDGDKATAYDIYPAAKLYGDLSCLIASRKVISTFRRMRRTAAI